MQKERKLRKFLIFKNRQNESKNRQIANIIFMEHKIVKMTIDRQIWQLWLG